MEYATFQKWLAKRGCRFDTQRKERGEGLGTVTIHREGRTAELPLIGARHNLDPRSVRQVCEALREPPRVYRRPFGLSHAAMAGCSSMA